MRIAYTIFNIFIFCNYLSGQTISKRSVASQKHLYSLIQGYGGGFIGLTTENNSGYKGLKIVRLDDLLNVTWSNVLFDSLNRTPAFIKQIPNTNLLIGSYTGSGALLLETDSTGNIIHKWNIEDSIKITDAVRIIGGSTYFIFERNNNSIPAGNLRSYGTGYIDPTGAAISMNWAPNTSHDEYPVNIVESNTSNPFFITHRESLNYWDCWIRKIGPSGNISSSHRYEIAYDIGLLRKQNLDYVISGISLIGNPTPSANFFIQLNSNGVLSSINGIQFLNSYAYYQGLNGLKCTESNDGGLFCAGELENKIFFFKISANDSITWAYYLPNSTINYNVLTVLNCSDHGFLIESSNGQTCELIKCDSNGISTCTQIAAAFLQVYPSFNNSSGTNTQLQSFPLTSGSSQFTSYPSNYTLNDMCLPTTVNEVNKNENELIVSYELGRLLVWINGSSSTDFASYEIFDLQGRLIFKDRLVKVNGKRYISDSFPETISNGIYLIKVYFNNVTRVANFIKN